MTSTSPDVFHTDSRRSNKPIFMVVGCTIFASAAQILLKMGVHAMPHVDPTSVASLLNLAISLAGNLPLMIGFALHGCNALLLIFALKSGDLSILWPIYSLSYVWVALLSAWFFGDRINAWKVGGIVLIILGVAVLGRVSQREAVE